MNSFWEESVRAETGRALLPVARIVKRADTRPAPLRIFLDWGKKPEKNGYVNFKPDLAMIGFRKARLSRPASSGVST